MNTSKTQFKNFITPSIVAILFILYLLMQDKINEFYHFSEWGNYIFILPLIYCCYCVISKSASNKERVVVLVSTLFGIMIPLFLSRNPENNFLFEKLAATFLGAIIAWICGKTIK